LKQCNDIIAVLDRLEENRPLYLAEANLRSIVKRHIEKLLKSQKEYRKKRYTVRWIKLGDESTKFFHVAAIERFRLNTITSLDTEDERTVFSHAEKAAVIYKEYRNKLGFTIKPKMNFDLQKPHHSA
jgi:hypothetical protein